MFDVPYLASPAFFAAAVPAVLLAAISKGGFGGGVVFLAVPLMSLVISPGEAAAILLPILFFMDVITIYVYRKTWSRGDMKALGVGAVAGTALGWYGFALMTEDDLRIMIGVIAVVFSLDHWIQIRPRTPMTEPHMLKGAFWGTVGGFTSFYAHAGSPPMSVYLLPRGLEKRSFVGTFAVYFFLLNAMKLPAYWELGQFTYDNLVAAAVLAPLVPPGIWMGIWCQKRLSDQLFYQVCYVFLFATGVKLLWDGAAGYLA